MRRLLLSLFMFCAIASLQAQTITAHSGAFDTPDNSMEFIRTAIKRNAKIIEIDVNMRPNGVLVINHDEVKTNRDGTELSIVMRTIRKSGAQINLDIKKPETLPALYRLIRQLKMQNQVFLTGIRMENIPMVRRHCPGIRYYLNYGIEASQVDNRHFQKRVLRDLKASGAVGINVHYKEWSREFTDLLHDNGYEVSLWTLNEAADAPFVIGCNPDNITSRHPDMVERQLKKHKK